MLRSCCVCVIETWSKARLAQRWEDVFGRRAGRHHQVSGPREARVSGLFPALRVHSR